MLIYRFRGVAVITSALHAEGRRFDPGRNHFFFFSHTSRIFSPNNLLSDYN